MGEQRHGDEGSQGQGAGKALKRRGILAAAGAVVAGLVAKQTAQPVAAAATMLIADTSSFVNNVIHGQTSLTGDVPTGQTVLVADARTSSGNAFGFYGYGAGTFAGVGGAGATNGVGVFGGANGFSGTGVSGSSDIGFGVYGQSSSGRGVQGNAPNGCGVYGLSSSGFGVCGKSTSNFGVIGQSTSNFGVYGESTFGNGVLGYAISAGTTSINAGVYGFSNATYGVIGSTGAAGYSGLTAITNTAGVAALAATSTVSNAYAAYFTGSTVVQGDFVAFGGSKSAAVKDATGQHRLVYCVESPEAWFEDFGTATLANGKANVTLDKTFTEIVHTNDYHVFLTPESDFHAHVTAKSATGFVVQQTTGTGKASASSGTFSYRIVARRKDIAGERLAKFEPPRINHPDPDKLPKPEPTPPTPPRKP